MHIISYCYTIGHSNHSTTHLIELLSKYQIESVADVRRYPYSSYVKQYNQENFRDNLEENGFEYLFLGDLMGGKVGQSKDSKLDLEEGFAKIKKFFEENYLNWKVIYFTLENII